MKITPIVLSIPPYISTSWTEVSSIQMKGEILVITLKNGQIIEIPHLNPAIIQAVFNAHALSLESSHKAHITDERNEAKDTQGFDLPFKFGISTLDGIGSVMQHNPAQANSPDLPPQVLEKIAAIAKIVSPEDLSSLPEPEPHCNCMHCQIARAIQGVVIPNGGKGEEIEEEISPEDLSFQEWDIVPIDNKLFHVINRLDPNEKYRVYLGDPIGCTCGKTGCEHILAVLKS